MRPSPLPPFPYPLDFERFGADGDDGEVFEGVGGEVGVYFFEGDGVDEGAEFFEGAGAAAVVEVVGEGAGAGAGGVALHDDAGLHADEGAGEFVVGDAVGEAFEFDDEGVEGFLGAVGGGAGVAEDGAPPLVFEGGSSRR